MYPLPSKGNTLQSPVVTISQQGIDIDADYLSCSDFPHYTYTHLYVYLILRKFITYVGLHIMKTVQFHHYRDSLC